MLQIFKSFKRSNNNIYINFHSLWRSRRNRLRLVFASLSYRPRRKLCLSFVCFPNSNKRLPLLFQPSLLVEMLRLKLDSKIVLINTMYFSTWVLSFKKCPNLDSKIVLINTMYFSTRFLSFKKCPNSNSKIIHFSEGGGHWVEFGQD